VALLLEQPTRGVGYRVSRDAFLLARFAHPAHPVACVCDLGAGVGPIGLSLLAEGGARRALLVELDPAAAALAETNAAANGFADRTTVLVGDAVALGRGHRGEASLVVCNPPYYAPGAGRTPTSAARARARVGELPHFVRAARLFAGRRAKVAFVYPAAALTMLLDALRAVGLEPKRAAFVHGKLGQPARVVLVEAQAGKPGGLTVEPAIVDH